MTVCLSLFIFVVASIKRFLPQKCISAVQTYQTLDDLERILAPIESTHATSY